MESLRDPVLVGGKLPLKFTEYKATVQRGRGKHAGSHIIKSYFKLRGPYKILEPVLRHPVRDVLLQDGTMKTNSFKIPLLNFDKVYVIRTGTIERVGGRHRFVVATFDKFFLHQALLFCELGDEDVFFNGETIKPEIVEEIAANAKKPEKRFRFMRIDRKRFFFES